MPNWAEKLRYFVDGELALPIGTHLALPNGAKGKIVEIIEIESAYMVQEDGDDEECASWFWANEVFPIES